MGPKESRTWSILPIPPDPRHPVLPVSREAIREVGKEAGIWLVTTLTSEKHHWIIAVSPEGELATHGGFVLDDRAIGYARVHFARYHEWVRSTRGPVTFELKLNSTTPLLKKRIARGDTGTVS